MLSAAREMNRVQEEQGRKKKRQFLPKKVKKNMVYCTWKHGNPEARRWASKRYPDDTFKRETVKNWKVKCQKAFESNKVRNFLLYLVKEDRPR